MNTDGLDPALQPSIALIANSIPRGYATVILIFVLFSLLFQNVAQLLATSRFIWALSRESALPFSAFFRRLSKKNKTPVHAILATWAIVVPALCLIAINVSILATTMLEGAGITAVSSYLAPVVIYLVCSGDVLRGDGRAQWTLRRLSQPLCVPVALFLATFMVTMCLPTGYPINSREWIARARSNNCRPDTLLAHSLRVLRVCCPRRRPRPELDDLGRVRQP